MIAQPAKRRDDQQLSRAALQFSAFAIPVCGMGDERGIQAGLQGGINFLLRTAAHQPGVQFDDVMLIDQTLIDGNALLGHDLDGIEESLQSGTLNLGSLFRGFAFGEEDHPVAAGEIGKRFRYSVEYAGRRLLEVGDHVGNFLEGALLRQSPGELQVALPKRTGKAAHAISVLLDILPFGLIQDVPRIGASVTEGLDQ